jgi:hypothetical protein
MSNILLLSCTKSKLDYPAPAKNLYSASPLFRKSLEYGKTLNPDETYILSAKHHLVPLNKKLKPYDLTLRDFSQNEKEKWAKIVVDQMREKNINLEKDKFIFLAGMDYMEPLLPYIPEQNIITPLKGKKLGERISWLNKQIKKLKEQLYETFKTAIKRVYSTLS